MFLGLVSHLIAENINLLLSCFRCLPDIEAMPCDKDVSIGIAQATVALPGEVYRAYLISVPTFHLLTFLSTL